MSMMDAAGNIYDPMDAVKRASRLLGKPEPTFGSSDETRRLMHELCDAYEAAIRELPR
jgi:hypothetical protein